MQKGDLLLIYAAEGQKPDNLAEAGKHLAAMYRAAGKPAIVVIVPHDFKIEHMDSATLEEHGWRKQDEAKTQDQTSA